MLDYPIEKEKLMKRLTAYMSSKHREYSGFLAEVPSLAIHEGNRYSFSNSENTDAPSEFEELGGEISISLEEAKDMTLPKIIKIVDKAAKDMADQQQKKFFRDISKSLNAGNAIQQKPEPFSKEMFLKGLDSIEHSFDKFGNPISPMLIIPSEIWQAKEAEFKDWEKDVEFGKKHAEIIERKREAWRAREATRKLVD